MDGVRPAPSVGSGRVTPLRHSLCCPRLPDLRLFLGGQGLSQVGTWMQAMALQWLVWRSTHSAVALVLGAFFGQFPGALLGVLGGAVADRHPRRTVLLITQSLAMLQAAALGVLTLIGPLGAGRRPLVYALAAALGIVTAFDLPARQALLAERAGEKVETAVAINSSIFNGARLLGPAIAGVLVSSLGEGVCFLLNSLSYGGMLLALWQMDSPGRQPDPSCRGALADGVRFAARSAQVRPVLALLALSSVFGWSCLALAPLFASRLGGGVSLLGALLTAVGLGSLAGATALLFARGGADSLERRVAWGATTLGVGLGLLAASAQGWTASLGMVLIGFGFAQHLGATNMLLHVLSPLRMRGRVMGIFLTTFIGITPLGGLAIGWLATRMDAAMVVSVATVVVVLASTLFHGALASRRRRAGEASLPSHTGRSVALTWVEDPGVPIRARKPKLDRCIEAATQAAGPFARPGVTRLSQQIIGWELHGWRSLSTVHRSSCRPASRAHHR